MNQKILSTIVLITAVLIIVFFFNDDDVTKQSIPQQKVDLSSPFLRAHYIDAGQADATLLQIVNEGNVQNVLIDAGDWNRTDVLEYLDEQNISSIDIIAITHAHADHIGQLAKIIEQYSVEEVWMNGETATSQVFLNALEAIDKYDVGYNEPEIGDTYHIGPLQVDILHTSHEESNSNNNSIAMMMTYGDVKLLFTGDAEKKAEDQMLARNEKLRAHVFQVGHHGSNTSNTPAFYQAVKPQIAIYSAAENNSYGLPNEDVLERITSSGADLYGTAIDGTVIVETDGKRIDVTTERDTGIPVPLLTKACISLNQASIDELQKIVHVGEKMANDIIAARPIHHIDELITVKGIGDLRLQAMKDQGLICTEGNE